MTRRGAAGDPAQNPGVVGRADRAAGLEAMRWLIGDVEDFLAEHWATRPSLTTVSDRTAVTNLLSVAAVDALLAERGQRAPTVRLVRDGTTVPVARYTTTARIGAQQVSDLLDAGRIQAEFAAGATISVQALQRYWPPLAELCRTLECYLTHPVQANAYLSPPRAQGLRVHHDTHDVFVLQVEGSKHFDVYEPAIELPVSGQHWSADEPPGVPSLSADLRPGDCLYMPRGWRHRAFTADSHSLHLTIGVLAQTWLAVVDVLAELLAEELDFRRPLPVGFAHDPDLFTEEVAAQLKDLSRWLDGVSPGAVSDRLTRRYVTGRATLPLGGLTRLVESAAITADTVVRRRPGLPCLLRPENGRVELVLPDRVVSFPAFAGPVLVALLEGPNHCALTLPSALDVASRVVVVRRLVVEGLLEPE